MPLSSISVNINTVLMLFALFFCLRDHVAFGFSIDRTENSAKNLKSYSDIDKQFISSKSMLKLEEDTSELSHLMQRPSSQYALHLFKNLLNGENLADAAGKGWDKQLVSKSDTVRSYSPKETKIKAGRRTSYKFSIPPFPTHEYIQQAELRLHRHNVAVENSQHDTRVHVVVKKHKSVIRKIRIRRKPIIDEQYYVYDITSAIRSWINGYHGNLTLEVKIQERKRRSDLFGKNSVLNTQKENDQTIFVIFSNDSGVTTSLLQNKTQENQMTRDSKILLSRKRRASHNSRRHKKRLSNKTGRRRKCQIHDYQIDFDVIGWGKWIIHPKQYNSRMCKGVCPSPLPKKYSPNNLALLMSLMRYKDHRAPKACCVPAKLKPLSMMYYEYDEIVVRHHQDMVVEECGCR